MGIALSLAKRQQIIKCWESVKNFAHIARQHQVAYHTIRTLCKRFEQLGKDGIQSRYGNCGPKGIKSDPLIYRASLWLKRLHPKWGAPFIRMKLEQRYKKRKIPCERTFQIWFRAAGFNVPKSQEPREAKQWAKAVHEIWQMDGKEEQKPKNKDWACWLTIVDEHSGGLISAPAFSKKEFTMFLLGRFAVH